MKRATLIAMVCVLLLLLVGCRKSEAPVVEPIVESTVEQEKESEITPDVEPEETPETEVVPETETESETEITDGSETEKAEDVIPTTPWEQIDISILSKKQQAYLKDYLEDAWSGRTVVVTEIWRGNLCGDRYHIQIDDTVYTYGDSYREYRVCLHITNGLGQECTTTYYVPIPEKDEDCVFPEEWRKQ